jgi:hypothetical protein
MTTAPLLFDRALLRARLDRAAPGFDAAGFLKARAAEDAVMRLEAILREFPVAVDLGSRNGAFSRALEGSDARAKIGLLIETDLSTRMLAGRDGVRIAPTRSACRSATRRSTWPSRPWPCTGPTTWSAP